jgi:hypothetical protein
MAGMGNEGVAGYFCGGWTGSDVNTVDKYAFPTETRTTLSGSNGLSDGYNGPGACADDGVAGYVGGGNGFTGIDKFAFPSDTRSAGVATLSVSSYAPASFAHTEGL